MKVWMRTLGVGCLNLLVGMISVAADGAVDSPPYDLVEVSSSVVMALHDNGSNISCVALEDGLVFFDASLSTRTARLFRQEMETRFKRQTRALVLTHAHLDHILGMAAFDDVPVHAAAAGRPRWDHFVSLVWDEGTVGGYARIFPTLPDEIPDAELRLPTDWFDDELVLGSDDSRLLISRTAGHTVDSSSSVVGAEKIVVAGDLVQARRRPYFGEPDTDFDAWIDTLRRWEDRKVGGVCPGHGPVIDLAELPEMRVWFEGVRAAMTRLKARGVPLEETMTHAELPAGYWPDDEVPRWWSFCIRRLYDAS